ncbi:MAG: thiamine pyrophosphate-binding protein [Bacteroidales bacterium]|jgi:acetolactate synthase-1/2/3 large subunit
MKVATYIAQFIKEKGINTVFELQGGMITRLLDEFNKHGGFNIVSMHHEQAAAFAADAFGRITGKPGIALGTSGPGATNLVTGIGSCFFDSVPAIFITGQVNLSEQKNNRTTRQIGFQETDIVSIVKPITKAAYAVKRADDIPVIFKEAWKISLEGRPGPVLIDIPMDLQKEEIQGSQDTCPFEEINYNECEIRKYIDEFRSYLKKSKRPLVLAGHGVRLANSTKEFLNFIEKLNLPVVTSLLGMDNINFNHPNRIGFIGTYGNRWANYALGTCDLLLVLGSRLDLRQTGSDLHSFMKDKIIFHIDIDKAELNNRIKKCKILRAGVAEFLQLALQSGSSKQKFTGWFNEINQKRHLLPDTAELTKVNGINPNVFIHLLSHCSKEARVLTTDVGNNQMWVAQSIELNPDQRFLSSGGMGAMGYSLPAAIGASYALNRAIVLTIIGDGGFQINIQELQTIRRNNLPVKMVILNNHSLGMIRQFQDAYFNSCYQSTVNGYSTPNFEKVAIAYGINAVSIESPDEIEFGLKSLWQNPNEPFLLNVKLDIYTNVYPKMMFGNTLTNMEPANLDLNK